MLHRVLFMLAVAPVLLSAQAGPVNLDFKQGQLGAVPSGWRIEAWGRVSVKISEQCASAGARCVAISQFHGGNSPDSPLLQSFKPAPYLDKTVRLRASVRVDRLSGSGSARMSLSVNSSASGRLFEFTTNGQIASSDWQTYEVVGYVDPRADTIQIRLSASKGVTAFFDKVSFEVFDVVEAPPRPEDRSRIEWLAKNSVAVRSIDLEDDDFADLMPLKNAIGNARMVQLGEASRNDGSAILAKQRLVRFLHEKMGFNVLAWQSGFYSCEEMNAAQALRTETDWSDFELAQPIFEYARGTHKSAPPLRMTGFGIGFSGFKETFGERLFGFLGHLDPRLVSPDDRKMIQQVVGALPAFNGSREPVQAILKRILEAIGREKAREAVYFRREVEDLSAALEDPAGQNRKLGENLVWLAREWYPDQKIIVWADTARIVRNNTPGQAVHAALGEQVYSIAFTGYRGYLRAGRWARSAILPPQPGSLEALLHATGHPYVFLDLHGVPKDHWLGEAIPARLLWDGVQTRVSSWPRRIDAVFYSDRIFPNLNEGPPVEALAPKHAAARKKEYADSVKWISDHAIRLDTVEAGHGFADMQRMKKVIGNARVVALGEATHGTREFFQLKHRMLEFLVEQMGFTVFGIEANLPEAFDVNHYVLTGEGDPAKALAGLYFWVWDTEEVLTMIRWMRAYNADPRHAKKVKFYGFDMQFAPRAVKVTLAYLAKVDPDLAGESRSVLESQASLFLEEHQSNWLTAERRKELADFTAKLLARFDERKGAYVKLTSADEWSIARQHLRVLGQSLAPEGARGSRDRSMAENIAWILDHEGPDAKIAVWAHNEHVSTYAGYMGDHLRKTFGADMVVLGFAFNRGDFRARPSGERIDRDPRPFTVGPSPEGSIGGALASVGLRYAALDLQPVRHEPTVAKWFGAPHLMHDIGWGFDVETSAWDLKDRVVLSCFDALLFVENTTASRPNPGAAGTVPDPWRNPIEEPANLDFENGAQGRVPPDWSVFGGHRDYRFALTTENPARGRQCAMISRPSRPHASEGYGSIHQIVRAANAYAGKRVKLRASVRTDVSEPYSHVYLYLGPPEGGYGSWQYLEIRPGEWRECEIVLDAAEDLDTLAYGLALEGNGRAWLDAVSLEALPNTQ